MFEDIHLLFMQQLKEGSSTWYFALGAPQKTSLCSQFCRENDYSHLKDPKIEDVTKIGNKHAIIQGSLQLFKQIQKKKPQLSIILVGKPNNQHEHKLCEQYARIGRLKRSPTYKYEQFRKKVYPNIIFVYGPVAQQNKSVAINLSSCIGYSYVQFVNDPNQYISHIDKCFNYVVNGLFQDPKQIRIMSEYFQIRVVHLKYNRVDLNDCNQFFDKEFNLVSFLKDKNYYIPVSATNGQEKIRQEIGEKLCPRLIYVNASSGEQIAYVQKYVQETDSLLLGLDQIQTINKRKGLALPDSTYAKLISLCSIFYKDLSRKTIVLSYYPWSLQQTIDLEKVSRKISLFVDLVGSSSFKYNKTYFSPFYFLQSQKYIRPNRQNSLKSQLQSKVQYWLVTGPAGAGKSSVAKQLANEFGFKVIEFQPYLASVKQKLIAPEDGQQLPAKKAIQHFRQILSNDQDTVHVIDGLPYTGKDLQNWIAVVGAPNVINLEAQVNEQIKRSRKKAEADLAAEINEQQLNKAKESTQKNRVWIENLINLSPSSSVYKVDYNDPQIKVQGKIRKILSPRIFLVQKNATNLYQNIAVKYGLGFFNLNRTRLRECQRDIKKCKKRDIIICNHGHEKKRIASQDLYWIQKNLGEIRYLGIWEPEQKQYQEEKMVLERPPAPEKPKAAEGEAGEQKPPEDPPAEGQAAGKKKFDIYDYEWTKPGQYKNLSQWFFKSKHHIKQIEGTPENCFNNFSKVLETLNQSEDACVYEKLK